MSGRRFKREFALTISKAVKDRYFVTTESVTISQLRCAFQIVKTIGKTPNTCSITVYNLAEQTRALTQDLCHMRLEGGYDGDLSVLFDGDVTWGTSNRDGVDWITKLTGGDGHRAINHARVSRSHGAGVDVKTLIAGAAKAMGLSVPTSIGEAKELVTQFASGYSMNGRASDEMTKVLRPHGYDWSVQDGALQVVKSTATRPGEAWVITARDILGVPDFGPPPATGKQHHPTLKFTTSLFPQLGPGSRVKLDDQFSDKHGKLIGTFKVIKVTHTGDSLAADWKTEVEAWPVK